MKTLSLFACSGISEYYLHQVGIEVVVANELIEKRANIYSHIYPESNMIQGDICEKYDEIIGACKEQGVECIIATPPCQSFSTVGSSTKDDPRTPLFSWVLKAIKDLNVKYCLIENVPSFLTAKLNGTLIKDIIDETLTPTHNVERTILNSADYGTPQNRKRAILLISRLDCKFWSVSNVEQSKSNQITLRESIGHLESLKSDEQGHSHKLHKAEKHSPKHILWMTHTETGKSAFLNEVHFPKKDGRKIKGFSNTYKRMEWDVPAPTITMASGSISSQTNVHPGEPMGNNTYSNARALTLYEIILLTGLDDEWATKISECLENNTASKKVIRDIIGEAFPPKFCLNIFKHII